MERPPDSANLSRTDTSSTEASEAAGKASRAVETLVVVLEADRPDAGSFAVSLEGIRRVVLGRGSERRILRTGVDMGLDLPDRRASKPHASLERSGDGFLLIDLGSSNGTFVGGFGASERITESTVAFDQLFRVGHSLLVLLRDGGPLLERARTGRAWPFATLSPSFARELGRLERVAASTIPLLLLGETGTGKEVLARAVHERSARPGAFVAVNCGALPESLVEAHLFGHLKGAFSGATRDEVGFVRAADHGTLFLDEIGDLALGAQASLLRVLQEGEVTPVGAFHPVKVDVRVLSATHHPLIDRVASGTFRADLFARLSGFSFQVPPLRERRFDVGELLASFWQGTSRSLRPDAALALLAYDYPMNVRELKQAVDAATVLAEGTVQLSHLPTAIVQGASSRPSVPSIRPSAPLGEADAELREELAARLHASGYNLTKVAREMGKARQQVQRWVKRFGLKARP